MGPSDYALLEFLDRLGGIQGRKKLQKLTYIAKLMGAPIEDDFFFHYYGPYSTGLASRVDQLADARLLEESTRPLAVADGIEYSYVVTDSGREFLESVRSSAPQKFCEAMEGAIHCAVSLKDREVFQLELISTLLYWRCKGCTWEEAESITERRKQADRRSRLFGEARQIALEVWEARTPRN